MVPNMAAEFLQNPADFLDVSWAAIVVSKPIRVSLDGFLQRDRCLQVNEFVGFPDLNQRQVVRPDLVNDPSVLWVELGSA